MAVSAWFLQRIALLAMTPWKYGLLVIIPVKTYLLLAVTSAFLWIVLRGKHPAIALRTCMSALTRCAYMFVVGEAAVAGAMAAVPSLRSSPQPIPVPGLATLVQLPGIAGQLIAEATLTGIWFMVSLSFIVKGMTGWGTGRSFLVGGATWGFLSLIRICLRLLASGALT
jgi:hypothetical protein